MNSSSFIKPPIAAVSPAFTIILVSALRSEVIGLSLSGPVNPVIAEMTNMICFQVIGNDQAILWAAQAGQFELNVMMPLVAWNLPQSFTILTNCIKTLRIKCVDGITANKDICLRYALSSSSLVTALNPIIGYSKAAEVFKRALKTGQSIPEAVVDMGLMTENEVKKVIDLPKMVKPGVAKKENLDLHYRLSTSRRL